MDPRHPPLNDGVPAGPGPAPPGLPSAGHRLSGRRAALAGRGGGVCLPSPPQRITGQRGLSGREEACEPNHRRRPRPSLAQPGLPLRAPGPAPTTGPRVVSAPPPGLRYSPSPAGDRGEGRRRERGLPRPVTPPPHLRPRGPAPSPPHLGGAIPKAAAIRPAPSSLRPHNPRPLPRVGSCSPPSRTGPGVCESTHLHRRPPIRPPCGFFLLLLGPGSGEEKPPRRLPGGREGTARQAGGCGLVRGRAPPPLPRAGRQAGRLFRRRDIVRCC